jgi:predicted nucleic acid-binding protein
MKWVLDASVALKWFIAEPGHETAEEVLHSLLIQPELFAIPELFPFEVFAVLGRLHPQPAEAFRDGVIPILDSGILRQPMTEQLASDAEEYRQLGLSAYDACYAALAYEIGGAWLTFDEQAHRILEGQGISFFLTEGLPPDWGK